MESAAADPAAPGEDATPAPTPTDPIGPGTDPAPAGELPDPDVDERSDQYEPL